MAGDPIRILVIDTDRIRASVIEEGLRSNGYDRVTLVHEVAGVMRRIVEIDPDVIVIDLENPNRDELEHMFQISRVVKRPVAMFVDRSDQSAIVAAIEAGVSAYVVDGLKRERISSILETAITRFKAVDRLRRELDAARDELRSREVIEKAKMILMRSRGVGENQAYAQLRSAAMNASKRISDIAESVVVAAGLLGGDDR